MKVFKRTSILLLSFFVYNFTCSAQTTEEAMEALKYIHSFSELIQFQNEHPKWASREARTMISDSIKHPKLVHAKPGDIVSEEFENDVKLVYKVLEIREEEYCKLKYIYLNGKELSDSVIDSLRTVILNKYHSGQDFESLIAEYTMNLNKTGDLNWFHKGFMVDEFDAAVRPREQGEIFTVNVPDRNWYYVVLKTHANKIEKTLFSVSIYCK